jgi:hypothetical protein
VLLLFGLALILNVSTSAAATCNTTAPKVTAVDPANHAIIHKSQTIKVTFNETIKAGTQYIELKNGKVLISTKKTISGKTLSITPTTALASGYKYTLILHTGSVTDLSGNGISLFASTFTVSPITLAQMKDGLKRSQTFFNTNQRLPNYVSYGTTKIPIAEFQRIIATQGLKINTKTSITASTLSSASTTGAVASIMKTASKYGYSHAASTAAAMERIGAGDCWAMSEYLYNKMTAAGVKARIIQYSTSYSSNHRSVQYILNNAWVNAPYRTYFSTSMFNNTQSTGTVIRG